MSRNWIVVAAADHVRRGTEAGFMQVNHGKAAPLRRIAPGDRVACYSPTSEFRGKDKLQAFTAIGTVRAGEPYQFDMGGGFRPFRRDVDWLDALVAPIQPLLPALEFAVGGRNWGYRFRFGVFDIGDHDIGVIAAAMAVRLPGEGFAGGPSPVSLTLGTRDACVAPTSWARGFLTVVIKVNIFNLLTRVPNPRDN